jgi:predicted helicase
MHISPTAKISYLIDQTLPACRRSEELFSYVYSILFSPTYRLRYVDFLKRDFPRIPIPIGRELFAALAPLGAQLVAFHLLKPDEAPVLQSPEIRFADQGEARVERGYPKYKNGKVMINANRWFEDVPKEVGEFHVGGYQVCEKWLKDRAGKGGQNPRPGRVLTDEDILHYRRVVVALTETRRIMTDIDRVIDQHGGWPDAFTAGGS